MRTSTLREHCDYIVAESIRHVLPDTAVELALKDFQRPKGKLILVAIGKAAYQMAARAHQILGEAIDQGIVITKHGHAKGAIGNLVICEAGHPVPDEDTFLSTEKALEMTSRLSEDDLVLFLVSGGGSALFEKPAVAQKELQAITDTLLKNGANIRQMNTIRKRLSLVKGGKFAQHVKPARIFQIILSDVLGDPLDVIASGPAYPDASSREEAWQIVKEYKLQLSEAGKRCMETPPVSQVDNVTTCIAGNVTGLCRAAAKAAESLGYQAHILTDQMDCEAREAGKLAASIALYAAREKREKTAYILGGETVVHVTGNGLGGRNQELALSAALSIDGVEDVAVFSLGSDGTDGPTNAAGGYVDGATVSKLRAQGIDVHDVIQKSDSYHALEKCGGLLLTGPTGTNVNDITVVLVG